MAKKRESSTLRSGLLAAGGAVALTAALYLMFFSGPSSAARSSRHRFFVDAATGKPFEVDLEPGMVIPVKSPDTGKMTGVEAELCYWTADGQPKTVPDPVLLNALRKPPIEGPTFCPVCHRLVVGHNPYPTPGARPPPTEAEYAARHERTGSTPQDR